MFEWLVENAGVFYWLLGLTALALAAAAWTTRNRKVLMAFAGVIGILALIWILSLFVDTDKKRLQRIVDEMAQGVREKKVDKIFQHVAKSFIRNNMNHESFRSFAEMHMRQRRLDDVTVSGITLISRKDGQAKVEFWVHTAETQGAPVRCEADFIQENGVWKMNGFDLFMGNTGNKWQF